MGGGRLVTLGSGRIEGEDGGGPTRGGGGALEPPVVVRAMGGAMAGVRGPPVMERGGIAAGGVLVRVRGGPVIMR